jgi:hypothetical protein
VFRNDAFSRLFTRFILRSVSRGAQLHRCQDQRKLAKRGCTSVHPHADVNCLAANSTDLALNLMQTRLLSRIAFLWPKHSRRLEIASSSLRHDALVPRAPRTLNLSRIYIALLGPWRSQRARVNKLHATRLRNFSPA